MSQLTMTVFSSEGCVQCNATYRFLDKRGVAYNVDDAMEETNNAMVKNLGIMSAPAVLVRDGSGEIVDSWGGFRPDKISEHLPALELAGSELVAA